MTKDLEETLKGLGPGYRAVVGRLVGGAQVDFAPGHRQFAIPARRFSFRRPLLAAACIMILAGFATMFLGSDNHHHVRANAALEYRLAETPGREAVAEMIRTQNADGSWRNDFLTRRNAAALATSTDAQAKVAYKKAMRNLRVRGLL